MSRLVLVRHAAPEEDARGRCYGALDVGLSAQGRADAARLAGALDGTPYDAVVASPRSRALETAEPLASARGLAVEVDDGLREIDFGAFEGRTYEEIEEAEPEIFAAWMTAPTTVRFPGGESYADLRVRAARALESIRTAHESAVVVTHGGVIRAGLAAWLELPDHAIFRIEQSYCGVTIVDWLDGTPIVRVVNRPLR
jgi:alpha-ribazole phosphatase/probable phosphoglycerate mutase